MAFLSAKTFDSCRYDLKCRQAALSQTRQCLVRYSTYDGPRGSMSILYTNSLLRNTCIPGCLCNSTLHYHMNNMRTSKYRKIILKLIGTHSS